jgi:hypothetical protein
MTAFNWEGRSLRGRRDAPSWATCVCAQLRWEKEKLPWLRRGGGNCWTEEQEKKREEPRNDHQSPRKTRKRMTMLPEERKRERGGGGGGAQRQLHKSRPADRSWGLCLPVLGRASQLLSESRRRRHRGSESGVALHQPQTPPLACPHTRQDASPSRPASPLASPSAQLGHVRHRDLDSFTPPAKLWRSTCLLRFVTTTPSPLT